MASILLILLLLLTTTATAIATATADNKPTSKWTLLQSNIGISAMHMQLLPTDRVLIYDRTDFGASNLSLPDGKCRKDPYDKVLKVDCTAHSIEYNVKTNTFRPLMVQTDIWCSSGSLVADGTVVQTGGSDDGKYVARIFKSCDQCDWKEIPSGLTKPRWYSTNLMLPSGRQIIIGGRGQYNYEFYPKLWASDKAIKLPFLYQMHDYDETNHLRIENNLYPFVFLNPDGNLFIFANNRAILLDYLNNRVVKNYPKIPGGEPRNYPSTGSAVLLPMRIVQGNVSVVEVLVCGGAPKGAYKNARHKIYDLALKTCGRIRISDPDPKWVMESMPLRRLMGDMVLLPNADVLIINGASKGSAGWGYGRNPVLCPVVYKPDNPLRHRFDIQTPSSIPRMYHSTAILIRDGRVLVGGSNPNKFYNFTHVRFPTELRFEAFSPSYLDPSLSNSRPRILHGSPTKFGYGDQVIIRFRVQGYVDPKKVSVTLLAPSFNTHSFSMNQRLLILEGGNTRQVGEDTYEVAVMSPLSCYVAPPNHYILFVVHHQLPSEGHWVQIG